MNLFDQNTYVKLKSISEVLDRVCVCKNDQSGAIECNYGTYKNCKFVVGKPFHCIINPKGQLRRKRDVRHLKATLSDAQRKPETSFIVSIN